MYTIVLVNKMTNLRSTLAKYWVPLQIVTQIRDRNAKKKILRILAKNKDFRLLIREIMNYAVNRDIQITPAQEKKLKKYKRVILGLANKRKGRTSANRIAQTGGFLQFIIPALLPIVVDLVTDVVRSKIQARAGK